MCEHIKTPEGEFIFCGLRSPVKKCVHCWRAGQFLCDWKVKGRRSGTCDRAMCSTHSREVAPGKHLCGEHSRAWDGWQRLHGAEAAGKHTRPLAS